MQHRRSARTLARLGDQRHLHVLDHAHRNEGLRDMEAAAYALAPDLARRQAGQSRSPSKNPARIRPQLAADHVEGGGLPRPVRTDHGQHLAGRERE